MLDFGFYNMDCMEGMKQFPDKYFDLAVVDPPYGGVTQGGYMKTGHCKAKAKTDYHLGVWQYDKPDQTYFDELIRVSKNQIIWGGNYYCQNIPGSQCWLVWDKEKPEGVSFADVELAYTSFNQASRIFHFAWNGMIQGDQRNREYKIHPTQKPVALYEWILNRYAKPNDIILDTHVGSASSLIACHNTGHKYVGFEIDETYYQMSKKRLEAAENQMNIYQFLGEALT